MKLEIMPSVCVVGLGYIGLPTAALLASKGYAVHGVDVHDSIIETINRGDIHIREPELDVLVRAAVQSGNLRTALTPEVADIFIIAVPTPFVDDHKPDLSYVESATRSIAPYLAKGNLVILESTSPVGTTERMGRWIAEERPDLKVPSPRGQFSADNADLFVAHCPERVLPGQILREMVGNDRIVGGIDEESTNAAIAFYSQFVSGEVLATNSRTAELAKLTENTFRDVNIALANELSTISEGLGVDVWELIELANHHPRVNILHPGPGVGGHCIAVDPWFIIDSAPEHSHLIRTAREVNTNKPHSVVERVRAKAARINNPTIACFGLAYKPDIDDLRESPAMIITRALAEERLGRILAVEPHVDALPASLAREGVEMVSAEQAMLEADIIVGLVSHRRFRKIAGSLLHEKIIIDTCGIWR